ncbi:SAP30-binding protein isoform X1 [Petromyzon marinus]
MEVQNEGDKKSAEELVASFSNRVRQMSTDEIQLPPEPIGRCSNQLQEKIVRLYERKVHQGIDLNVVIQQKKEFRNPSIYEKLIQFCGIDELGTNYPKDIFDPHGWAEDSYYEALAKSQKLEMEKLERAKKERTKIEFVTGLRKPVTMATAATTTTGATTATTGGTTTTEPLRRRSKWDSAVPMATTALGVGAASGLPPPPLGHPPPLPLISMVTAPPTAGLAPPTSSHAPPMLGLGQPALPQAPPSLGLAPPSLGLAPPSLAHAPPTGPVATATGVGGLPMGGANRGPSTTLISALGNIRKHRS